MSYFDPVVNLKQEEGFRKNPYKCSEGYWTIGFGTLIEPGMAEWSREEAEAILRIRVRKIREALEARGILQRVHPTIGGILVCMAYQLGVEGLLDFQKTLRYMVAGDHENAAREMLDSRWARQTPERAHRYADYVRLT